MSLRRQLVRHLLVHEGDSQKQIAADIRVDPKALARELTALVKDGIVELQRDRQQQVPRLRIFKAMRDLETAVADLRSAAS